MGDILNTVIALLVGLACGFFFERRTTKSARAYSAELERELSEIRHSVLSMGGDLDYPPTKAVDRSELVRQVRGRALATQNSEGRVSRAALRTYFVSLGHAPGAIDDAVRELCSSGQAIEEDQWLLLK